MRKEFLYTHLSDDPTIKDIYNMPNYTTPRDYRFLSRYSPYRRIVEKDNNIVTETFNSTSIVENENDQFYTVDITTENRLDIISTNFYGNPTYWWILAMANNIIDPFDVPIGTLIRIPLLESIYKSEGVIRIG